MTLQSRIKEDMKNAMKAKEPVQVTTLRGVMSAMTNKTVELGRTPQDELSDEEALAVIKTEVKRRKDAQEQFHAAGRDDLADNETEELAFLMVYLPEMMSRDAIRTHATAKMTELGVTDKSGAGKLMSTLMADLKGAADGADVKAVVDELLSA